MQKSILIVLLLCMSSYSLWIDTDTVKVRKKIIGDTAFIRVDSASIRTVRISGAPAAGSASDSVCVMKNKVVSWRTVAQIKADLGVSDSVRAAGKADSLSTILASATESDSILVGKNGIVRWRTKAQILADIGACPLAHKTTEDAINGLVKVNGSGTYTAVADASGNWNTAYGWGNHASGGYFVGTSGTIRALFSSSVSGLTYNNSTGVFTLSSALSSIAGLSDVSGWLHNNGAGVFAYTTPTYSEVGALGLHSKADSSVKSDTSLRTDNRYAPAAHGVTTGYFPYANAATTWANSPFRVNAGNVYYGNDWLNWGNRPVQINSDNAIIHLGSVSNCSGILGLEFDHSAYYQVRKSAMLHQFSGAYAQGDFYFVMNTEDNSNGYNIDNDTKIKFLKEGKIEIRKSDVSTLKLMSLTNGGGVNTIEFCHTGVYEFSKSAIFTIVNTIGYGSSDIYFAADGVADANSYSMADVKMTIKASGNIDSKANFHDTGDHWVQGCVTARSASVDTVLPTITISISSSTDQTASFTNTSTAGEAITATAGLAGNAINATSTGGCGIYSVSSSGYSGYFDGKMHFKSSNVDTTSLTRMSYNIGNPHAFWGTFTRSESKPAIKLIDKGTLDNNSSLWVVHFPDDATTQSGFGEVTVSKGSISSQEGYCHFKFGRNPAGNVEVAFLDQTTDVTFHNSDYGYDFCIVSSPTNDAIFFINYTGESKFILYEITCSSGF